MINNIKWILKRTYQLLTYYIRFLVFKCKKNEITGLLKIYNEDCYLSESIDSIIDSVDKLIIIYHDITDNSISIIDEYKHKFPTKISSYEYKYKGKFYYYKYLNYGLKKIKSRWYFKVDADQIYFKNDLNNLLSKIKQEKKFKTYFISGINIWNKNNDIYFLNNYIFSEKLGHYLLPINGLNDHYITPNVFLKYRKFPGKEFSIEKMPLYKFSWKTEFAGIYWIHLSFIKRNVIVDQKFFTTNINDLKNIQIANSNEYDLNVFQSRLWYIDKISVIDLNAVIDTIKNNILDKMLHKKWLSLKNRG